MTPSLNRNPDGVGDDPDLEAEIQHRIGELDPTLFIGREGNEYECFLFDTLPPTPEGAGVFLTDIVRHVAEAYENMGYGNRHEITLQLYEMMKLEMHEPTGTKDHEANEN